MAAFFRMGPVEARGGFRLVVNRLYYDAAEPASSGFAFDEEILLQALRNIYAKKGKEPTYIEEHLFREFCRGLDHAVDDGFAGVNPDDDFISALRHSNEVFSAFKVHRAQRDMAARLVDSNGNLKPFEQWLKDVQPIASHQCSSWFQTEYDTAVIRAHQAADWKQFERERDVLPNLKWMPSTSANPGADHRQFWGTIRPIDDKFWKEHRPGDRWNCKCSLSSTDEPATPLPNDIPISSQPQPGLSGNPGQDAAVFSDDHPYFPSDCRHCAFYKPGIKARFSHLFNAKTKDCYNCPYIDGCVPGTDKVVKKAAERIKAIKETIDPYEGFDVRSDRFITGNLKILRRSLQDVFEHEKEDATLMQWLSKFSLKKVRGWKYEGWAPNRPYEHSHPKYDPKNPNKKKHPETDHFLYYSLKIGGKTYWANVKVHNYYHGEVLYTIESERPKDLIVGKKHKKRR